MTAVIVPVAPPRAYVPIVVPPPGKLPFAALSCAVSVALAGSALRVYVIVIDCQGQAGFALSVTPVID